MAIQNFCQRDFSFTISMFHIRLLSVHHRERSGYSDRSNCCQSFTIVLLSSTEVRLDSNELPNPVNREHSSTLFSRRDILWILVTNSAVLRESTTTILRQSGWSFNLSLSLWTDSTEVDRETPWRKVEAICAETRLVIIARLERVTLVNAVRTFLVSAGFSKEKETGGGKFMVVGRISHLASRSATNDFTLYAS